MATARLVLIDETNKVLGEEILQLEGVMIDDVLRAARAAVQREGHTIRSLSPTGASSVLIYAYQRGRAPKSRGAIPGWVWKPPKAS